MADQEQDGVHVLHEDTDRLRDRHGVYLSTLQVEEACLASEQGAAEIDITPRRGRGSPDGGHTHR